MIALAGLSQLSDEAEEGLKILFTTLWVALVAFIAIYEFLLPKYKAAQRRQIDFESNRFFQNQVAEAVTNDPYDPAFGYADVSKRENDEHQRHPDISIELLNKIDSEDPITAAEFIKMVTHTNLPSHLYYRLSEEDQNKREVIEAGINSMGTFLRFTPEQFRDDEGIVNVALASDKNALDFASPRIRNDKQRWAKVWPELSELLFSNEYPDLREDHECLLFLKRLVDTMEEDGFVISNMRAGESIGLFGIGLVQATCHYMNEYVLEESEQQQYNPSRHRGKTVYVERLLRFYFKFITNGNFDDQPFLRITNCYESYGSDRGSSNAEVTDVRWYDNFTQSTHPSSHKIFFARLCQDIQEDSPISS